METEIHELKEPVCEAPHERIFGILFNNDEITWQSLLYDLVKKEQMDPWDVDVSLLANKYIDVVKKMKELDLRVSGKVVLAAAILLKIKSTRLLEDDILQFDNLLSGQDEESLLEGESLVGPGKGRIKYEGLRLIPKTPQPRARKVSVFDLVEALQQALDVQRRRAERIPVINIQIPEKKYDISILMSSIYKRVMDFFTSDSGARLTFSQLVPSEEKTAKVLTFIPLLHLSNARKVDLVQEVPFADFEIRLSNVKEIDREIGAELVGEFGEIEGGPEESEEPVKSRPKRAKKNK